MVADQRIVGAIAEIASAHGVDRDLSALGAMDGLFGGDGAGIVIAIANHNENARYRLGFRAAGEFFGRKRNGVPKCGATGGCELANGVGNQRLIAGEILDEKHGVGETDDEGEIVGAGDDGLHEMGGGLLFEFETGSDGVAGIDDEAEAEGEFGFVAKTCDGSGMFAVVEDSDILEGKVGDRFAVIRGSEKDGDFVGRGAEGIAVIFRGGVIWRKVGRRANRRWNCGIR